MTDIGGTASRGGAVTLAAQMLRIAIYGVSVVVLARLLDPSDYGLLAMVVAIVGVGELLRDFGLSFAAIQASTLSKQERSNLFWVSSGAGLVLGVAVFALSWPIAVLYGEPRLVGIAQALSLTFVFNGVAAQYQASLTRSLEFRQLAMIDVLAPLVGLVAAIVAATAGWAYWALVAQQVCTQFTFLAGYLLLSRWWPGRYARRVPMRRFFRFGGELFAGQLLGYVSRNIDALMIGARYGAAPLGYYNMAFQLMSLPLNQLSAPSTRVALPVLSRVQDDLGRFSHLLLTGQTILVNVVVFVLALAAALAEPLIRFFLGTQWLPSVGLLQILAIGGIAQTVSYATYWAYLSLGLTNVNLRYALVTRPILVAAVVSASFVSVEAVAAAYSLSLLVFWPLGLWWLARHVDIDVRRMFFSGLRAICLHVAAATAAIAVSGLLREGLPIVQIIAGLAAQILVIAVVAATVPAVRRDLGIVISAIRSVIRRERRE